MMILRKTKRTTKRFNACLPWNEAEVTSLIQFYPKTHNSELAIRFGRSQDAVRGKARGLGLKKDYSSGYRRRLPFGIPWSATEINLLRELYPDTPNEEIAEKIDRTFNAIQKMAEKLSFRKMEFWSEDEDKLLEKLYKTVGYDELAKRLGRTNRSIQIRLTTLSLESKVGNWTKGEVDFLEKSYPEIDFHLIAEKLGRTHEAVRVKAGRMKLIHDCHRMERKDATLRRRAG